MMRNCLTLSIGLVAAALARADTACTTLADTASGAGLTGLLDAVTAATPVLEESEEGRALLEATGVSEALPTASRVTVFAPTNAAFEAVIEASGGDVPPALLADVLLNHVVVGALPSDAILGVLGDADDGTTTVSTLLGGDLVVSTDDGTIFVMSGGIEAPGAAVETADVETCAGVVHVIDTVLLPGDSAESPASEEEMAPATAPEAACSSISDTATEAELTALLGAITLAATSLPEAVVAAVGASNTVPAGSRVTVFAPTDAAFADAAEEFGGELPDDEDVIASVLLNHIVPAELTAAAIVEALGEGGGSIVVQSLLGSDLFVTTVGDDLYLQSRGLDAPGAEVVVTNVETCAGIVHVIDDVLLPAKADGSEVMFDMMPMEAPGPAPSMGSPDMAAEMGPAAGPAEACAAASAVATEANLTALVDAITFAAPSLNASVVSAITADTLVATEVTIFTPTDDAFAAAAGAFGGELPDDADVIADVLLNHIVQGALSSDAIIELLGEAGGSIVVQSLLGSDLFVTTVGDSLYLQSRGLEAPSAEVVLTDVATCAGVVHVIDTVLLPAMPDGSLVELPAVAPAPVPAPAPGAAPSMAPDAVSPGPASEAPGPAGNCAPLGVTATESDLTTLASLLTAYETELSASEEGSALLAAAASTEPAAPADRVTVFAPSNEAFDGASAAFGGELPADAVPDVLLNHVVPGDLTAAAITTALGEGGGSTEVKTLSGGMLFVTTTDAGLYVQSAGLEAPGALVVTPDVITCPGPVHVINTVLLPQFPDGTTADLGVAPDGAETQTRGGVDLPPADEGEETPAVETGDDTAAAAGVGGTAGWLGMAAAWACLVAVAL